MTRSWMSGTRAKKLAEQPYCEMCGRTDSLVVHHKAPVADAPEVRKDLDNLQVLCQRCHKKAYKQFVFPERTDAPEVIRFC